MAERTSPSMQTSTINITEEDLQSSLKDFLKSDEEKESPTIWNIRTLGGLAILFVSLAFVGQSIGAELFGTSGLGLLNTAMKVLPYLGGAMLAVICIGFIGQSKKEKKAERQEETRNKKTYDKLDDFLYSDESTGKKPKSGFSQSKGRSKQTYSKGLSRSNSLTRSRSDSKLFGVCGGLAKYLGLSSTVLRIGFLIAFFLSSGSFFLLYIAMAIVMPKESVDQMDDFN